MLHLRFSPGIGTMPRPSRRPVFALAALALATGLGACGPAGPAGVALPTGTGTGGATGQAALPQPPLPHDAYVDPAVILARRPQYAETQSLLGDEFYSKGNNTVVDGAAHTLTMNAGRKTMSYGMYRFENLTMQDSPLLITVHLTSPPPAKFYVAISNYAKERWLWQAVDVPALSNPVGVPGGIVAVNPGGAAYVVVAVYDRVSATIASIDLQMNIAAPAPLGLSASQGTSGSTITLSWTDPAESYPGLLYDRVIIDRASDPGGPWAQIGLASPGVTSYDDVHRLGENNIPHNTPMYYRQKTVVAGNPGLPGQVAFGFRLLQDVTGCSATDGLYDDQVVISWNTVNGADGYMLYNKNESGGFPMGWSMLFHVSGGDVTSAAHTTTYPYHGECLANTIYNYRVTATYQTDESLNSSNEDTGYRNSTPTAAVTGTPPSGNVPLAVQLDASASHDPDGGSITLYEWDWEGDGSYDFSGTDAIVTHDYARQGRFAPAVRVTDDEGSKGTASTMLNVLGWTHTWGQGSIDVVSAGAFDMDGNCFAVGYTENPGAGGEDVLLLKYAATGALQWHKTWGGGDDERAEGVYADLAGNVYVSGWTRASAKAAATCCC